MSPDNDVRVSDDPKRGSSSQATHQKSDFNPKKSREKKVPEGLEK